MILCPVTADPITVYTGKVKFKVTIMTCKEGDIGRSMLALPEVDPPLEFSNGSGRFVLLEAAAVPHWVEEGTIAWIGKIMKAVKGKFQSA